MFTLGESQSERHILGKEKIPRSQNKENKGSKNKESEFFQQEKHFRTFLECNGWTASINTHDKLI